MSSWTASRARSIRPPAPQSSAPSRAFWTCRIPSWLLISSAMPHHRNRSLRISHAGLPHIDLEVVPSRRLQIGTVLLMLLVVSALVLSPAPTLPWRLSAALVILMLAWHPLQALVFGKGRTAVRRAVWAADGTWAVTDGIGTLTPASLAPTTGGFGPWILLVWTVSGRGSPQRRYALVDCAAVGRRVFRALRARLRLTANRSAGRLPEAIAGP